MLGIELGQCLGVLLGIEELQAELLEIVDLRAPPLLTVHEGPVEVLEAGDPSDHQLPASLSRLLLQQAEDTSSLDQ